MGLTTKHCVEDMMLLHSAGELFPSDNHVVQVIFNERIDFLQRNILSSRTPMERSLYKSKLLEVQYQKGIVLQGLSKKSMFECLFSKICKRFGK